MMRCPVCDERWEIEHTLCPKDGTELVPDEETDADDSFIGLILEGGISLTRVAGVGAMGTVYEGWQTTMDRKVAVKMLHPELARESGFLERFMREARAVARLNHPNIVTVYSIGEVSGAPYIVMEFVEGSTVAAEILEGALHPVRVVRIARQIASALADAHAAGVIHRDLKPSNVLLSQRRRASDFVKLLDFGVAKLLDADAKLTRDGFVFGTPAYLSPEQANGAELDRRSDLYSLGVCMFEMLSQTLPFTGNQVQMLLAHAREPAPLLASRAAGVPSDLAALVDALLRKDPNDRPDSAEVVADILDELLGDGSPSPWASVALGSSEWTTVDLPQMQSSTPAPTAETRALSTRRPRPRPRPFLLALAGSALVLGGAGSATLALRQYMPAYPLGSDFRPYSAVALPGDQQELPLGATVELDAPRSATMTTVEDYVIRLGNPADMVVSTYYELTIDLWDPTGEPLSTTMSVVFTEPASERWFPVMEREPGSFFLQRRFDEPGTYGIKIYSKEFDEPAVFRFEVADKS